MITMRRICNLGGNYTAEQQEILQMMVENFRVRMADDDPNKNILNQKRSQYTDEKIVKFLMIATQDINGGSPSTHFTIFDLHSRGDDDLVLEGAMVFCLMAEGILQLRNQVDYSDSGLSIAMFNKTGQYQGWAGFLLQQYTQHKTEFKACVIPESDSSGFYGIGSEFGYRWF